MTAFSVVGRKLAPGHVDRHFMHVYKSLHLRVIEPVYLHVHLHNAHFQCFQT